MQHSQESWQEPPGLQSTYDAVATYFLAEYGIAARTAALERPVTGQFDGKSITLSTELDVENQLFVLLHLFGHIVQWNTSDELREIGITTYGPHNTTPEILDRIRDYEIGASRYGLAVLHSSGVRHLDAWLSDWSNADVTYLLHLYRSGEKPHPFEEFRERYLRAGTPKITADPIPDFELHEYAVRYAF